MRLLKNAIGCRSPSSPTCNRMPPVTKSEELTSRTASLLESKWAKMGVELTRAFRVSKACWYASSYKKSLSFLERVVRGPTIFANSAMNRR